MQLQQPDPLIGLALLAGDAGDLRQPPEPGFQRRLLESGAQFQAPALAQGLQRLIQYQPARGQHQYPVTDCLHLLHDMGGENHGGAPGEAPQQLPHLCRLLRIQAVGRLIEDQQARLSEDGLGHADPLAQASGQAIDRVQSPCAEVGGGDGLAQGQVSLRRGDSLEGRRVLQIVRDQHFRIDRQVLRQVAELSLYLACLARHIGPVDGHAARRGLQKTAEHAHDGSLAGAVVAQQPDDLIGANAEGDVVYRRGGPVVA